VKLLIEKRDAIFSKAVDEYGIPPVFFCPMDSVTPSLG
jgi:hypothetical protein